MVERTKTKVRAKTGDGPLGVRPRGVDDSPSGARGWLQRRRLAAFYALALLSVCALIALTFQKLVSDIVPNMVTFLANLGMPVNVVGILVFAAQRPAALLVLGFMVAPSVAAVVVALAADGWPALRLLLRRFHPCPDPDSRGSARRSYLLLLVAYVVVVSAYLTVARLTGTPEAFARIAESVAAMGVGTVVALLVMPLLDEGALFQELGWRGYALPLLLQRLSRSPLLASILLGLMWWTWYLPRELSGMAFGVPFTGIVRAVLPFLVYLIGLSILITYFWFRTGGSVLPAILIHGGANAVGRLLGAPVNEWAGTDLRNWLVASMALVLLARVGPSLGQPQAEVVVDQARVNDSAPDAGSGVPVESRGWEDVIPGLGRLRGNPE